MVLVRPRDPTPWRDNPVRRSEKVSLFPVNAHDPDLGSRIGLHVASGIDCHPTSFGLPCAKPFLLGSRIASEAICIGAGNRDKVNCRGSLPPCREARERSVFALQAGNKVAAVLTLGDLRRKCEVAQVYCES